MKFTCIIRRLGNMLIAYADRVDGVSYTTQTTVQTTVQTNDTGVHIEIVIDQSKRMEKIAQIEKDCDLDRIRELGRKARAERKMEMKGA